LTGPQGALADMRRAYASGRDALTAQLRSIDGIRVATPDGALYAFANASELMRDLEIRSSSDLSLELLHQYHLACVGGSAFGERGEHHLRFSFAVAGDQLADALARLAAWGRRRRT